MSTVYFSSSSKRKGGVRSDSLISPRRWTGSGPSLVLALMAVSLGSCHHVNEPSSLLHRRLGNVREILKRSGESIRVRSLCSTFDFFFFFLTKCGGGDLTR